MSVVLIFSSFLLILYDDMNGVDNRFKIFFFVNPVLTQRRHSSNAFMDGV